MTYNNRLATVVNIMTGYGPQQRITVPALAARLQRTNDDVLRAADMLVAHGDARLVGHRPIGWVDQLGASLVEQLFDTGLYDEELEVCDTEGVHASYPVLGGEYGRQRHENPKRRNNETREDWRARVAPPDTDYYDPLTRTNDEDELRSYPESYWRNIGWKSYDDWAAHSHEDHENDEARAEAARRKEQQEEKRRRERMHRIFPFLPEPKSEPDGHQEHGDDDGNPKG